MIAPLAKFIDWSGLQMAYGVVGLRHAPRPPILPCRADQYLVCQKQDIEFEIRHLTSEQEPQEKSWFQKLFRR